MSGRYSPLVSVLMTAYNREAFIAMAIESVLASTYQDFELLIIDDNSVDNTLAVAQTYARHDRRIKVFANAANLGQFANRNKAASLASGEYIKYFDSDDILYPHSLEIMMSAMLQFPEAGIGVCEKYREATTPYPFRLSSEDALQWHYLKQELLMVGPSGTVIKKKAFDEVKGFEDFGMPSDNHLTLKIAALYPVVVLQRDLFWWRRHNGQVFQQTVANEQNILNNYRFNKDILKRYSPLDRSLNRKIQRNLSKIFFRNLVRIIVHKRKPLTGLQLMKDYLKEQKRGQTT